MSQNFMAWFNRNTRKAQRIIKLMANKEDREELENTFTWLKHELQESHKIIKWFEDATKEVCSDEQYAQIQNLYMTFVHNDFIRNSPVGREMYEKGQIKAASTKILLMPEDNNEENSED